MWKETAYSHDGGGRSSGKDVPESSAIACGAPGRSHSATPRCWLQETYVMRGRSSSLAETQARLTCPLHSPARSVQVSQGKEPQSSLAEPADLAACASLLRFYTSTKDLASGQLAHDHIIRCGHHNTSLAGTLILQLYLKCGAFEDAFQWFANLHQRDSLSWNLIIGACVQEGQFLEALQHFELMQLDGIAADKITYIHVLSACPTLDTGMLIYESIRVRGFESDTIVGTALVTMFGRHGSLDNARAVFNDIGLRNVVSWNAMLSACAQNGQGSKASYLFNQMQQEGVSPDKITFLNVCSVYASQQACLGECKKVHAHSVCGDFISDNVMVTALVYMYGKCGYLNNARMMFNQMDGRKVVSWNAMITLYAQQGHTDDAFHIFNQMQVEGVMPDNVTFVCLLDACASQTALAQGKRLHLRILHSSFAFDVVLATALVNAYGKCGNLHAARVLFDEMPNRNVVSWNAMIAAYAQYGHGKVALELFDQMQVEGMIPNKLTFIEVFSACASQATLAKGKIMHSYIMHTRFEMDDAVANTLMSMYGKCGSVKDSQKVFDKLHGQKTSSWNALIAAYSQHGNGKEAVQLFAKMIHKGVIADDITFVSILAACSHGGLLDEGHHYFVSMHQEHPITPTVEHYDCMIDLLCRAGLLVHAAYLINKMPCEPTIISWTNLLCACRNWVDE